MNGNHCHLEGVVWRDAWSRTPVSNPRAVQVRCWLTRPTTMGRREFFLCVIVPKSAEELALLERELQAERRVTIEGCLQMADRNTNGGPPDEWQPGVVVMANWCGALTTWQIVPPQLPRSRRRMATSATANCPLTGSLRASKYTVVARQA